MTIFAIFELASSLLAFATQHPKKHRESGEPVKSDSWGDLLSDPDFFESPRVSKTHPGDSILSQCTQKNEIQKIAYFNHVQEKRGGSTKHTTFAEVTFAPRFLRIFASARVFQKTPHI